MNIGTSLILFFFRDAGMSNKQNLPMTFDSAVQVITKKKLSQYIFNYELFRMNHSH